MQSASWTPEHSAALREFLGRSMSYSEIAEAINTRFNTAYTRNAAIGRAQRMGLAGPERSGGPSRPGKQYRQLFKAKAPRLHRLRERYATLEMVWPMPVFEAAEPVKLRCVEIDPRHLSLLELERGDCRYPYGGDAEGEAITFCGHPRRPGSSYCAPHLDLTRGPGTASERAADTVSLRIVEAA